MQALAPISERIWPIKLTDLQIISMNRRRPDPVEVARHSVERVGCRKAEARNRDFEGLAPAHHHEVAAPHQA